MLNSPLAYLHRPCCHDGLVCCFKLKGSWVCLIQRPNDLAPPVTRGTIIWANWYADRGSLLLAGSSLEDGVWTATRLLLTAQGHCSVAGPLLSPPAMSPHCRCKCGAGLHSVRTVVVIYLPNNPTRACPNTSLSQCIKMGSPNYPGLNMRGCISSSPRPLAARCFHPLIPQT